MNSSQLIESSVMPTPNDYVSDIALDGHKVTPIDLTQSLEDRNQLVQAKVPINMDIGENDRDAFEPTTRIEAKE